MGAALTAPTHIPQLYYQRKREEQILSNNDFSFKHDAIEDNTFQLVDTSKSQSKGRYSNIGMYSYSLMHYSYIYTKHHHY